MGRIESNRLIPKEGTSAYRFLKRDRYHVSKCLRKSSSKTIQTLASVFSGNVATIIQQSKS